MQKAQEIPNPSKHKDPLDPLRQLHSNGESPSLSFGANVVHVSKYKDQDSRLLFISEHEDPRANAPSEPTAHLYVQTRPIPSTAMRGNSVLNMQENNAANAAPMPTNTTSGMMGQTSTSHSSCVLPTYYCVALSQQPQFTQLS